MAAEDTYTGTDWQPETKITTDIMKTMDEGIKKNSDLIESAAISVYYSDGVDDMLSDFADKPNLRAFNILCYGTEIIKFLTNGANSNLVRGGIAFRNGTNVDYLIFANTDNIYFGRISLSSGELTSLRQLTASSITVTSVDNPIVMDEND